MNEQFVRNHMMLRAIESKLQAGFHDSVMLIEIEPINELNELVLANQKINKFDFGNRISFDNLKFLGKIIIINKVK